MTEIWLDELWPLLRNFFGNFGVTIAREVDENHFRARLAGPANLEEIDAPGASGSRTGARQLGPHERIDHARFADIGAAEKSNLGHGRFGEVRGIGRRGEKSSQDSHAQVCNGTRGVGKPPASNLQQSTSEILKKAFEMKSGAPTFVDHKFHSVSTPRFPRPQKSRPLTDTRCSIHGAGRL